MSAIYTKIGKQTEETANYARMLDGTWAKRKETRNTFSPLLPIFSSHFNKICSFLFNKVTRSPTAP